MNTGAITPMAEAPINQVVQSQIAVLAKHTTSALKVRLTCPMKSSCIMMPKL
jgi:hypothetical protein